MSALGTSVLYLVALNAVACGLLAWGLASPSALAVWAVALAVAQGLGERLGESFEAIPAKRRDKVAQVFGTVQLSVLVLALVLAAGSPTPGLLGFLANVLCGYQLLALLLVRLAPHAFGVVGQSLALLALVGVRGGPLAAWTSASTLALIGVYVGLDHHARLLAAHRLDEGPHAARAMLDAALLVLPVALLVGLVVAVASPEARPGPPPALVDDRYRPLEERPERELDTRALRTMLVTGLAGAVAVYYVGRWLARSRTGERTSIEAPEPLRGGLERIRPEARRAPVAPSYPGRRGRVVRAYVALLRGAKRAGFPRRPDETPDEFADALADPREPLRTATDAFVSARYGPTEVSEEDVVRAERGAADVLAYLSRRPPRRRREVLKDPEDGSAITSRE